MAHLNQFFNSNLTEQLWQETPDAEKWDGNMWFGLYREPEGSKYAGHILSQETSGDGWVARSTWEDPTILERKWEAIRG